MIRRFPGLVRVTTVTVLLGLAAVLAACDVKVGEGGLSVDIASGKAGDEWVRTYDLSPGGLLEIVNTNGPIEVRAAAGDRVEVRAVRALQWRSEAQAAEALTQLRMEEVVERDHVAIQARFADASADATGRTPRLSVRYRVLVPKGLRVSVRTQNGGITLDGVDGTLVAATTNGGVSGSSLSGAVDATVVNGGIRLHIASLTGDARLSSVNGGVLLELPSTIAADIEATAVNGGVSIDDRLAGVGVRRDEGAGGPTRRLAATLNGGGHKIALSTTNGGVRVTARGEGPPRS